MVILIIHGILTSGKAPRIDIDVFIWIIECIAHIGEFYIKGGDVVGPSLKLLGQYFIGYTVTVKGAFVAFGYSFVWGFLFGWLFAYLRNLFLALYIYRVKKKAELLSLEAFFEHF